MKEIIIIAGPNGSGKTTLAGQLKLSVNLINADMYEKMYANISDKKSREQMAVIAVAKEIKEHLKQGKSFAFETVFSTTIIPKFLLTAKKHGYTIKLHFIATDNYDINIKRVAKRVSLGGHDIPTEKLIDRYKKSIEILPNLLSFADNAIVYDNSKKIIKPFLIKESNQIKIIDLLPKWSQSLNFVD